MFKIEINVKNKYKKKKKLFRRIKKMRIKIMIKDRKKRK